MSAVFVLALTCSLLLFAFTAWVLLGWGSIIIRLFRMHLPGAEQNFSQLWLGFALGLLGLQLLNYFMPINWVASTLLAVGGVVAWWLSGHKLPRISDYLHSPNHPHNLAHTLLYLLAVLFSSIWIAIQSMHPLTMVDSGLYHLQSIRWHNEYAIVPGLGNLYGRLALNQAFLAFAAALNFYPFFNYGYALANGFLILLLAMEGWHVLIFRRGEQSLSTFATLCTLPIAAYMVLRLNPASPSPSTASGVLQLLIWLRCARLFEQHDSANEARTRVHIILILAATALTLHQSNIVFVTTIALIVLVRNWFVDPHPLFIRMIILFRLSWLSLLILVVWVGRGYFLSGYPAFPSTFGGFAVDWAMPQFRVEEEAHSIALAAKFGNLAQREGNWIIAWLRNLTTADGIVTVLYPLLLTLLLVAVYLSVHWALHRGLLEQTPLDSNKPDNQPLDYALLTLPILLALLYWGLTLPDPTLVRSLFWLLPILTGYIVLARLARVQWSSPRLYLLQQKAILLMVNGAIVAMLFVNWPQAVMVLPGFAPLPDATVIEERLPRRLTVWTPLANGQCWNAQLPCTPYVNSQLRRRGTDIQHGFRVLSPYPSLLAMQHPNITLCQRPLPLISPQQLHFAWIACGKPKG